MKYSQTTILNYYYIIYNILSNALTRLLGVIDQAGRLPFAALIITCFIGFRDKSFRRCFSVTPIVFWVLWCIYSFLNWFYCEPPTLEIPTWVFINQEFIIAPAGLVLVYYEANRNLKRTTLMLLYSFLIYIILGITMQERGTSAGGSDWEMRGMQALGNLLPLNACCLIFVAMFANANKWLKNKWMYTIVALGILSIFMVATRKALVGVSFMVIFYVLSRINYHKPKNIFKLIFVAIVFYGTYSYVMDNTLVGQRFQGVEESGEAANETNIAALNFLGDRASHYYYGWQLFIENPINGVGIRNVPNKYDFPYPFHTEYMTQLAECGIIGTTLYLLFIIGIIRAILNARKKKSEPVALICLGGLSCILFIGLTAWTFDSIRYFVVYALILAYCRPISEKV